MSSNKEPVDYGMYIDQEKAFVICTHEFNTEDPGSVRVNAPGNGGMSSQEYCTSVMALLEDPHRVVIFGPTEEKYALFTALDKQKEFEIQMKELAVTPRMDSILEALDFTLDHFSKRPSF